jgi:hypothetical protein
VLILLDISRNIYIQVYISVVYFNFFEWRNYIMSHSYKPKISPFEHAKQRSIALERAQAKYATGPQVSDYEVNVNAATTAGKIISFHSDILVGIAAHRMPRQSSIDQVASDPFFDDLPHGRLPYDSGFETSRVSGIIRNPNFEEEQYHGSKYI